MVLERFHFFHFFTKFVSRGMVLGHFLVTFGDPEDICSDSTGYRNRDRGRDRGRDRDRDPQVESTSHVGVISFIPRSSKQLPNTDC